MQVYDFKMYFKYKCKILKARASTELQNTEYIFQKLVYKILPKANFLFFGSLMQEVLLNFLSHYKIRYIYVEGCISCPQEKRNEKVWNLLSIVANFNLGEDVANKR